MEPRAKSEPADQLIGQTLANRYLMEHRLGEGAMGAVYKAKHVKVGRPFAVKILHARLLEDEKVLQRFEREAELAGRLRHPNVIGVVDVGETPDGLRYMVMDFAEGPDMSTMLQEAPLPPQRIIHLVRQLLEGLFHAHSAGLIHRDFKPENVIVEKDGHGNEVPRIVDFGIAILREGGDSSSASGRLTTNGLVLGTPHYMAPEQAVNDPIDPPDRSVRARHHDLRDAERPLAVRRQRRGSRAREPDARPAADLGARAVPRGRSAARGLRASADGEEP